MTMRMGQLKGAAVAVVCALSLAQYGCTSEDLPGKAGDPDLRIALVGQALAEYDPRRFDAKPLASLSELLNSVDVAVTNLEVAIDNPAEPCVPTRDDKFFHGATPDVVEFLAEAGFDLVSLSNNHSWDFGACGVLASIEAVRNTGMAPAGTGTTLSNATAPAILRAGGRSIALIAVATTRLPPDAAATSTRAGVNTLDVDDQVAWNRNIEAIRAAADSSDFVISYQHYQIREGGDFQRRWARAAIDAGADVYVSHGRPELGGVEVYGDGLILYNLGNFIFHTKTPVGHYEPKAWQSVIADVVVDAKGLKEVVFTPIVLNERGTEDHFLETRGLPQAAIGEEAIEILLRFKELSDAHGTVLHIVGDKARLELRNVSTSH